MVLPVARGQTSPCHKDYVLGCSSLTSAQVSLSSRHVCVLLFFAVLPPPKVAYRLRAGARLMRHRGADVPLT
jgi:hypothetical protein